MARSTLRNPVGTHVKVGPGLVKGTLRGARELRLEAVQVFTGNPRGWALSEGKPAEDAAFREGCEADGIRVVVHAPYLVNVGSPSPATYERSVASVAHNVRRAIEIGACLLYTSPSPRDGLLSRMPSSA